MENQNNIMTWEMANRLLQRGLLIYNENTSYEDEELKNLAKKYEDLFWEQVYIQDQIRDKSIKKE